MVKTLTRTAARVYGALEALGSGSSDILERLLPFFEPLLLSKQGERFKLDDFAKEIRETYRWNFNTDIVEVFIPRLVDKHWLISENPNLKNTSYIVGRPDDQSDYNEETSVNEELRKIAEQFKSFSEALSPLTAIPREVDEFEDMLIEWLLYVEAFSEHNLDFQTKIKKDEAGRIRQFIEVPKTTTLKDEEQFLCARFVEREIRTNPEVSNVLARVASIGLLTEVVQDFVRPTTQVEQSDLTVYLDAPVALELLGVSGNAAGENIRPIVAELQRIGCRIRIFGQSIDEIRYSLQAVLQNPRPTGPTAQALARGEVLRPYVTEVANDPEPFLAEYGVQVTYRPINQMPSEHRFFTEENRSEIYSSLTFQQNLRARDHDTDITTLIMRQRKRTQSRDLFKSKYVVLTRNGLLAQLVRRKCIRMNLLAEDNVPPVIHRRVLAASMWLRTGLREQDLEVPKRLLLASCERVLALRPGVVDAVKRLTDQLGDAEKAHQLDLLVSRDRSAQMLMDKTLGAASVVNEENLSQLFDEMLHPYLEEHQLRHKEALREQKREQKKHLADVKGRLESAQKMNEEAENELRIRLEEDLRIIRALCREVEINLARNRYARKIFGVALSLIICTPALFQPNELFSYVGFLVAAPMSYLTITGNRLLGTVTPEDKALQKLRSDADRRRLSTTLSRFTVSWAQNAFIISSQPENQKSHLFDCME